MKRLLILPLLLAAVQAQSAVECTNQNQYVFPTTPTVDFELHADGTATHTLTGLTWMRCSLGQSWDGSTCTGTATTHTWQGALQLAADINSGVSDADNDGQPGFAGHTDWRLPNRNELESIVEERCWNPAINEAVFPGTPNDWYWSSSPYATNAGSAWRVDFISDDGVWISSKTSTNPVRLVRAGQ
ncbi:MAG: DUF1566 domain-containing protein [Pseudomonadota bacterium]